MPFDMDSIKIKFHTHLLRHTDRHKSIVNSKNSQKYWPRDTAYIHILYIDRESQMETAKTE